jgi:hypothetical protein
MAISESRTSGPTPVPENPKRYAVTIDLVIESVTELAAVGRVEHLCQRLTEDCDIVGWRFRSLELAQTGGVR